MNGWAVYFPYPGNKKWRCNGTALVRVSAYVENNVAGKGTLSLGYYLLAGQGGIIEVLKI